MEVSPDLISTVTDAVRDEVTAWQARPLEPMYPVVFFDALRVKIRDEATGRSQAIYLAHAVLPDGARDILGPWIEQTEGAKFWMKGFSDLKARGGRDILIAVTDGLTGMSEALAAVFPETTLQTCIVHLIRQSLDFANWKERKPMAAALRTVYGAPRAEAAGAALDAFARGPWGPEIPDRRGVLAPRLDPRDSVLCVSARGPARGLHDQRPGECPRTAPQDHQDSRALPERRGRDEADVVGAPQHHREMAARCDSLAGGDEPVRDTLRGPVHETSCVSNRLTHEIPDTPLGLGECSGASRISRSPCDEKCKGVSRISPISL